MRRVMLVASLSLVIVSVFFLALNVSRSLEQRQQAAVVAAAERSIAELPVAAADGAPSSSGAGPDALTAALAPGTGGTDAAGATGNHAIAMAGRQLFGVRRGIPSGTMDLPSQAPPSGAIVGPWTGPPPDVPVVGGLLGATATSAAASCLSPAEIQTLVATRVQEALNARPAPFDWRNDIGPLVKDALVPLIAAVTGLLGVIVRPRSRT